MGRSVVWDLGLLCQERGERDEGTALDGGAYGRLVRFASESKGLLFSLVGEVESSGALSIVVASASRTVRALGLPVAILSKEGEDRPIPSAAGARLMRFEVGEGVFTGDDFWGEIDLARSVVGLDKQVSFFWLGKCNCLLEVSSVQRQCQC